MNEQEIINEVFQGTPALKARLRNTPIVSKRKFLNMARPCDIFITRTPNYNLKTTSSRVISSIISLAQGSPYTSFCSTIISMAFLYIGIALFEKPLEAWPRNFVLTPKATLVARIAG